MFLLLGKLGELGELNKLDKDKEFFLLMRIPAEDEGEDSGERREGRAPLRLYLFLCLSFVSLFLPSANLSLGRGIFLQFLGFPLCFLVV